MQKICKNPKCKILFEGANRDEYCVDCYWIKQREDNKRWRKEYKQKHPKEQIGGERWDKSIMTFLREKRAKEDEKYAKRFPK